MWGKPSTPSSSESLGDAGWSWKSEVEAWRERSQDSLRSSGQRALSPLKNLNQWADHDQETIVTSILHELRIGALGTGPYIDNPALLQSNRHLVSSLSPSKRTKALFATPGPPPANPAPPPPPDAKALFSQRYKSRRHILKRPQNPYNSFLVKPSPLQPIAGLPGSGTHCPRQRRRDIYTHPAFWRGVQTWLAGVPDLPPPVPEGDLMKGWKRAYGILRSFSRGLLSSAEFEAEMVQDSGEVRDALRRIVEMEEMLDGECGGRPDEVEEEKEESEENWVDEDDDDEWESDGDMFE